MKYVALFFVHGLRYRCFVVANHFETMEEMMAQATLSDRIRANLLATAIALTCSWNAYAADVLTIEESETAGISMFRAHWDTPIVLSADQELKITDDKVKDRGGTAVWQSGKGPISFDALNRSLLVRFPGAAEKIAECLKAGGTISKVEIVLTHKDEELWPMGNADYIGPEGYTVRKNWGVDVMYRTVRPQWHAVAWPLRQPWKADPVSGPTFNAAVNGAIYWGKFGAQDPAKDRVAKQSEPAEVSYKKPEGRLDVTYALTDPALGPTLAARLRTFADAGMLVKKWETYDARFYNGAYEWGTGTGGRAIVVDKPKLVVTFAAGKADLGGPLPPAANIEALAAKAKADGSGGKPTAVIPTEQELEVIAKKFSQKPAFLEDWQWARVQELILVERPTGANEPFWFQFVPDYQINRMRETYYEKGKQGVQAKPARPDRVYGAWVDMLIGRPARGWSGFESAREMTQWYQYREALPEPAREAIWRYWNAWLMPDRATAPTEKQRRDFNDTTGMLIHPMADDPRVGGANAQNPSPENGRFDTYYAKTGDWRGNKSFFRSGFTQTISTQNFNTTSSSGALLAGALVPSERAMADGRHGMEWMPLRMYSWSDGSGQEHIDHYYYAVTVSGNKAVADFSQTNYDRLMGQSMLTKNMEELISAYHPGLRTFIAGSSRTSLEYLIGTQDGLQYIMHTVSKNGALRDVGTPMLPGKVKTFGVEVPPRVIAQQTQAGPWLPDWVKPMVDDKPLPYYARHSSWGGGMRTAYFGENYGMYSTDTGGGRIQAMAQWRREAKAVDSASGLGTLDVRFGVNETRFVNDAGGFIFQRGTHQAVQHKNKMIFVTSPKTYTGGFHGGGFVKDCMSMQASVGIFSLGTPNLEIYIDGKPAGDLPIRAKQGQKITIKDGVTYLGIVPLPSPNLGRDEEVVIEKGKPQVYDQYKSEIAATLVINSYNMKRVPHIESPLETNDAEAWLAAGKSYNGFTIELGDEKEHGNFEAFQKHIASTKVDVQFAKETDTVSVTYTSGNDKLEAVSQTFIPDGTPEREKGNNSLVAKINGESPKLKGSVERDTPYAQQGRGRAEKNGAILVTDEDRRVFVLTEPKAGVYSCWNPLPDLTPLKFTTPGGITVTSRGKVSLTRIVARPAQGEIDIDHAFKPGQEKEADAATALLIQGGKAAPRVTLNGKALTNLSTVDAEGGKAYVVPLQ